MLWLSRLRGDLTASTTITSLPITNKLSTNSIFTPTTPPMQIQQPPTTCPSTGPTRPREEGQPEDPISVVGVIGHWGWLWGVGEGYIRAWTKWVITECIFEHPHILRRPVDMEWTVPQINSFLTHFWNSNDVSFQTDLFQINRQTHTLSLPLLVRLVQIIV